MRTLLSTALLLLLVAGCSYPNVEYELGSKPVYYAEEPVRRTQLRIDIAPQTPPLRPLTAAFLPFKVRQTMNNAAHVGKETGYLFWQSWVGQEIFPVIEYLEEASWRKQMDAVAWAAAKGADLAVAGEITYFFAGGTAGDTRIALRLHILNAKTGDLLWSMEQSGHMAKKLTQDFILFDKQSRLPTAPAHAIITTMAQEMGEPVERWSRSFKQVAGPQKEESFTARILRWITMEDSPEQDATPEEGVAQPFRTSPPSRNQSLF